VLERAEEREQLVSWWGAGVVGADGKVDRAAVARIVFDRPAERERLERLGDPPGEGRGGGGTGAWAGGGGGGGGGAGASRRGWWWRRGWMRSATWWCSSMRRATSA